MIINVLNEVSSRHCTQFVSQRAAYLKRMIFQSEPEFQNHPHFNTEHINIYISPPPLSLSSCNLSLQFPVKHLHALQDTPILCDIKWTLLTQKVQIFKQWNPLTCQDYTDCVSSQRCNIMVAECYAYDDTRKQMINMMDTKNMCVKFSTTQWRHKTWIQSNSMHSQSCHGCSGSSLLTSGTTGNVVYFWPHHVRFEVEKVELGQISAHVLQVCHQYHSTIAPYSFNHLPPTLYNVFLSVFQFSPVSIISPLLHTHSFIYLPSV